MQRHLKIFLHVKTITSYGWPSRRSLKFYSSALQFSSTSTLIAWVESKDTKGTAEMENVTCIALSVFRTTLKCSCAERMPDSLIHFWYSIVKRLQRFPKTVRSQRTKLLQGCWYSHLFSSTLLGLEPEWKQKSHVLGAGIACETRACGSAAVRGYKKPFTERISCTLSQRQCSEHLLLGNQLIAGD